MVKTNTRKTPLFDPSKRKTINEKWRNKGKRKPVKPGLFERATRSVFEYIDPTPPYKPKAGPHMMSAAGRKVLPAKDTVKGYKEDIKARFRHVGTVDALTLLYGAADHVGDDEKAYEAKTGILREFFNEPEPSVQGYAIEKDDQLSIEDRFLDNIESYSSKDIFPLPQYLDLTTQRHVKTRYLRLCILLLGWGIFFSAMLLYFVEYRVNGILWIHFDQDTRINAEGCTIYLSTRDRSAVNSWGGVAALTNPYPSRCTEERPCFQLWYEHSRFDASSVTYDTDTNTCIAKESRDTLTPCKLYIMLDHQIDPPFKSMTISSTGDTVINKLDENINSAGALSNWKLQVGSLYINGTTLDVSLRNIKTALIRVFIQRGVVNLLGLDLTLVGNQLQNRRKSRISVGTEDLGAILGVGKFDYSKRKNDSCSKHVCGGDVKISLVNSTLLEYRDYAGGVCITAPKNKIITAPCVNCSSWNQQVIVYSRKDSERRNASSLAPDNLPNLFVDTVDGGIFVSLPDYKADKDLYKNVRYTRENKECIFPFKFEGQMYYECTTAKFNIPWCVISKEAQKQPSLLEEGGEDLWGYCNPYDSVKNSAFSDPLLSTSGMRFDTEGTRALRSVLNFENEKRSSPVVVKLQPKGISAGMGATQWLYATKEPYLYVRIDYLTVMSLGMLAPRQRSIEFYPKPGFCPESSLPDATLTLNKQSGLVSDGLKNAMNVEPTSSTAFWSIEPFVSPYYGDLPHGLYEFARKGGDAYIAQDIFQKSNTFSSAAVFWLSIMLGMMFGHVVAYILYKAFRYLEHRLEKFLYEKRKMNSLKKEKRKTKEDGAGGAVDAEGVAERIASNRSLSLKKKPRRLNIYEIFDIVGIFLRPRLVDSLAEFLRQKTIYRGGPQINWKNEQSLCTRFRLSWENFVNDKRRIWFEQKLGYSLRYGEVDPAILSKCIYPPLGQDSVIEEAQGLFQHEFERTEKEKIKLESISLSKSTLYTTLRDFKSAYEEFCSLHGYEPVDLFHPSTIDMLLELFGIQMRIMSKDYGKGTIHVLNNVILHDPITDTDHSDWKNFTSRLISEQRKIIAFENDGDATKLNLHIKTGDGIAQKIAFLSVEAFVVIFHHIIIVSMAFIVLLGTMYFQDQQALQWAYHYATTKDLFFRPSSLLGEKTFGGPALLLLSTTLLYLFVAEIDVVLYYYYGASSASTSNFKVLKTLNTQQDKKRFLKLLKWHAIKSHAQDQNKRTNTRCQFCENQLHDYDKKSGSRGCREYRQGSLIGKKKCSFRHLCPTFMLTNFSCICNFVSPGQYCSMYCRDEAQKLDHVLYFKQLTEDTSDDKSNQKRIADYQLKSIRKLFSPSADEYNSLDDFLTKSESFQVQVCTKRNTCRRVWHIFRNSWRKLFVSFYFWGIALILSALNVVGLWWMLGSVLTPERMLPLATSTGTLGLYIIAKIRELNGLRKEVSSNTRKLIQQKLLNLRGDSTSHVSPPVMMRSAFKSRFFSDTNVLPKGLHDPIIKMLATNGKIYLDDLLLVNLDDMKNLLSVVDSSSVELTDFQARKHLKNLHQHAKEEIKQVVLQQGDFALQLFEKVRKSKSAINFEEFKNISVQLGFSINTERLLSIFAKHDTDASATLDFSEFKNAIDMLQDDIVALALKYLSLSTEQIVAAICIGTVYLFGLLIFLFCGAFSFTDGDVFGATIQSLLPIVAGGIRWNAEKADTNKKKDLQMLEFVVERCFDLISNVS